MAYLEDSRYDGFLPTVWLAFGLGEPRFDFANARVTGLEPATTEYASANEPRLEQDEGMFFACSSFQPHPPAMLHDCDCLQSEYGSGRLTVICRTGTATFGPCLSPTPVRAS